MATFVLVSGAWLGAAAWRDVIPALLEAGHEVHPLTLTGVAERAGEGGGAAGIDLETHVADIIGFIEGRNLSDVVLVGHSYGGLPVSAAATRIPGRLARVVYVDSGALPEGTSQLDTVPPEQQDGLRATVEEGVLPPPPFDPAADPANLAGLDEAALGRLRADATPHPFGSWTQPVTYVEGAPAVATTLIACVFPVEAVKEMINSGHPYFARLADAEVVGLPTGHWPMYGEPARLAELLDREGRR